MEILLLFTYEPLIIVADVFSKIHKVVQDESSPDNSEEASTFQRHFSAENTWHWLSNILLSVSESEAAFTDKHVRQNVNWRHNGDVTQSMRGIRWHWLRYQGWRGWYWCWWCWWWVWRWPCQTRVTQTRPVWARPVTPVILTWVWTTKIPTSTIQ